MKKFGILDYGLSNLLSLERALRLFGVNPVYVNKSEDIKKIDVLIIPGDGAFKSGMEGIRKRKLTRSIKDHFRKNKPILGICLGMQILFTKGYEFGACEGLNIIKGKVIKFPQLNNIKIPHIGWNELKVKKVSNLLGENQSIVYFVHSYICFPEDKKIVLATTKHDEVEFNSVIGFGNVFGCQFHPEKSGDDGMKILKKFVTMYL